jgi:hypothetical protein
MVSPQAKREAVSVLMSERDFGVTRACGLLQISRSLYRYRGRRAGCAGLRERIQQIAETTASLHSPMILLDAVRRLPWL